MNPRERIRLIRETATNLLELDTPDLQLVLVEFGIETWNFDSGFDGPSPYEYVIDRLRASDETTLRDIHEYGCELLKVDSAPASSITGLWGSNPVRVFISHIHDSAEMVGRLKIALETQFGIDAFVAHADIAPSASWRESIKHALDTCHICVAVLDVGFHESQWCDQEIGWAMSRRIPVVPIRHGDVNNVERRDGFLEEHQDVFIPPSGMTEVKLAENVFHSMFAHTDALVVARKALGEAFVKSSSYDRTRLLWDILKVQPVVEEEVKARIRFALQVNRQVSDCVADRQRLPDLVEHLFGPVLEF